MTFTPGDRIKVTTKYPTIEFIGRLGTYVRSSAKYHIVELDDFGGLHFLVDDERGKKIAEWEVY